MNFTTNLRHEVRKTQIKSNQIFRNLITNCDTIVRLVKSERAYLQIFRNNASTSAIRNIDLPPQNEKRKENPKTEHINCGESRSQGTTRAIREDLQAADAGPKAKQESIKGIRRLFDGEEPTNEREGGRTVASRKTERRRVKS